MRNKSPKAHLENHFVMFSLALNKQLKIQAPFLHRFVLIFKVVLLVIKQFIFFDIAGPPSWEKFSQVQLQICHQQNQY